MASVIGILWVAGLAQGGDQGKYRLIISGLLHQLSVWMVSSLIIMELSFEA
jgi:hypothetical protein